jgi:hypothetical protein
MPKEGLAPECKDELTETQKALVNSFQEFLREFNGTNKGSGSPKKEAEDLRPFQVIFLVASALDVTLLYMALLDLFPNLAKSDLLKFFQELLPALGGALLLSYFDRLRRWLINKSANPKLGFMSLLLLGALLIIQGPICSVFIKIDPDSPAIEAKLITAKGEKKIEAGTGGFFLFVRGLQSNRIQLKDQEGGDNPAAEFEITKVDVLKGTLARLPFMGNLFKPRTLRVVYDVYIQYAPDSATQDRELYISAKSDVFAQGPRLENLPNNKDLRQVSRKNAPPGACPESQECWFQVVDPLLGVQPFTLTTGDYTITQKNAGCVHGPKSLQVTKKSNLEFVKECKP